MPPALIAPGATGDKVRDLQHRLLQLAWFAGPITGSYDDSTTQAVKGFQGKRGLPGTGQVDQHTWDTLVGMTRTPTHDEMYNVLKPGPALLARGDTGAKVKDLQARLKQLGWFTGKITGTYGDTTITAVKGFQDKRAIPVTGEVDQRTLDRLAAMTHTPTQADLDETVGKGPASSTSAAGLDPRCLTGARVLCISKTDRKLVYVENGTPKLTLDARFGNEAGTPTRVGQFSVLRKVKDDWSRTYGSKMPFSMYFSGGEAVHYSSDFAARGYNGNPHGCVNIRDWDSLQWLFGQIQVGDKVVVYW